MAEVATYLVYWWYKDLVLAVGIAEQGEINSK